MRLVNRTVKTPSKYLSCSQLKTIIENDGRLQRPDGSSLEYEVEAAKQILWARYENDAEKQFNRRVK